MLELKSLACGYGEMTVVRELSLRVETGQTLALVGANGAGKTSSLLALAGHIKIHSGQILLDAKAIESLSAIERVSEGIAWVPEGRRLFPDLTVRENLTVGGYSRPRAAEQHNLAKVIALFPRIGERLAQLAGSLSGGEQQMVAIGRALMAEPRLLLIDELSLGLMPNAIGQFYAAIDQLKKSGLAIVLVEQNTRHALKAADQVVVLESGSVVWQGTAEHARQQSELIDSYLGLTQQD